MLSSLLPVFASSSPSFFEGFVASLATQNVVVVTYLGAVWTMSGVFGIVSFNYFRTPAVSQMSSKDYQRFLLLEKY